MIKKIKNFLKEILIKNKKGEITFKEDPLQNVKNREKKNNS